MIEDIQEKIIAVERAGNTSISLVTSTVDIQLPVKTDTDAEIIPYQSALIGQEIIYSQRPADYEGGVTFSNSSVKVLSGPLKGKIYSAV